MKERQNNSDGVAMPHLRCSWDRPQVMRGAVKRRKPHHRNVVGMVPDGDFAAEVTSLTPYFCQRSLREQRRRNQTRVAAGSSSQLQTVDTSDWMVRFAKGDVQDYWPEPMSFSRRTDVAEVLELQLARANELFEEERRGGNVAAAVAN